MKKAKVEEQEVKEQGRPVNDIKADLWDKVVELNAYQKKVERLQHELSALHNELSAKA